MVDVEGFEGPLDLLLALARQQKVDLAKISILALADQYLAFIEEARKLRLELAADYLVMAAWLAYLKSRLLLPDANAPEGQSAEDMATALALRLKRLEAIRAVAEQLFGRAQLDRDVFRRGQPEPIAHIKHPQWTATLYDLLSAYAQQRQQTALSHVRLAKRTVWSLAEAREALERLIGQSADWTRLDEYLIAFVVEPSLAPTVFASSFASTLELVREGLMEVHQQAAFAPLYVRKRQQAQNGEADRAGGGAVRTARESRRPVAMPRADSGDARQMDESGQRAAGARGSEPEELRLLEAMLFASAEPLDEKTLAARLPQGIDVHAALRRACRRNMPRAASTWCGSTASGRSAPPAISSWLLEQGDDRDAQALARGDRDARHHRLSPAGDARRDRGHPRRDHLEGLGRRAAGDRMDPPARAAQGPGPAGDLWHHRGIPVAFRARRGRRSARARRAQGLGPARRAAAAGLLGADALGRSGACATTRTRSSRVTSISALRRRRSGSRGVSRVGSIAAIATVCGRLERILSAPAERGEVLVFAAPDA